MSKKKTIAIILIMCIIVIVEFGMILVYTIPHTPKDAHEHTNAYYIEDEHEFTYYYPNGDWWMQTTFTLNIPRSDYDIEVNNKSLRYENLITNVWNIVDPDNPYVKEIADRITQSTNGCTELQKIETVSTFINCSIAYETDMDIYNVHEYWATPVETLFLKMGDCEDRSILACSILIAMGIECAILDYSDHIAPAVKFDGNTEWYSADFSYTAPQPSIIRNGEYPAIHNNTNSILYELDKIIGTYRYSIKEYIGI